MARLQESFEKALSSLLQGRFGKEHQKALHTMISTPSMRQALAEIHRARDEMGTQALGLDIGTERGIYEMARMQGRAEGLLNAISILFALAEEEETDG